MSMTNQLPLQGAPTGADEDGRRSDRRVISVRWIAKITGRQGQELCLIRNISTGGVMANVYSTHCVGEQVRLEIRSGQQIDGEIAWMRDGCAGVRFLDPINVDEVMKSASDKGGLRTRAPRIEVYGQANIKAGARVYSVDLCDLSQGGVKVTLAEPIEADQEVVVSIGGLEDRKSVVRWQRNGRAGLSFIRPISFDLLVEWLSAQLSSDGEVAEV